MRRYTNTDTNTHIYICIYMYIYTYIYIFIYLCIPVCIKIQEGREGCVERDRDNKEILRSIAGQSCRLMYMKCIYIYTNIY